ncbi:hypothetical protein DT87_06580 [Streptomyces sp. NTK 937]|nr:hypothetical protein DT87_06580 [Streptomyces sp. NTK 937]
MIGASEEGGTIYVRHGQNALELGDEAIVDLDEITLEGRAMRSVRQAYNRIDRAGYDVSILVPGQCQVPAHLGTALPAVREQRGRAAHHRGERSRRGIPRSAEAAEVASPAAHGTCGAHAMTSPATRMPIAAEADRISGVRRRNRDVRLAG